MPYVQPMAPGFRYGLGTLSGAGEAGQLVKLSGDNAFSLNDDATSRSFGMLARACKDGEMPGIYCQGGIYETDQVEGTPGPGVELACDSASSKLKAASEGDFIVGEAIMLSGGILRFKLLV